MRSTNTYTPRILSASKIAGSAVSNAAGEDLGKIQELMIDMASGSIAFAVLTFGGFLGLGNKLFAVPWDALQPDAENARFLLNVAKERLKQAPGFDKDQWPNMDDEAWGRSIRTYYGTPY